MSVSRRGDYAIRMMIELARDGSLKPIPAREVGAREDVPVEFARSIATDLVGAGLLRSKRGTGGGLTLARPARDITVFDILRATDGGVSISTCTIDPEYCKRMGDCRMHRIWKGADRYLEEYLSNVRLDALVSEQDAMYAENPR